MIGGYLGVDVCGINSHGRKLLGGGEPSGKKSKGDLAGRGDVRGGDIQV